MVTAHPGLIVGMDFRTTGKVSFSEDIRNTTQFLSIDLSDLVLITKLVYARSTKTIYKVSESKRINYAFPGLQDYQC